jgi:hypothetical protein
MAPARVPWSTLRTQLRRKHSISAERLETIERLASEQRRARRAGRDRHTWPYSR